MKKLAFVDHSFRKKSLATAFLVDRLKEDYEVKMFFDESWDGGTRVDLSSIAEGGFHVLVLFQQINTYDADELLSLNRSVVLVPMYDAVVNAPDVFWYPYRKFKFINFSKTLHRHLLNIGIESFYCQYFPSTPSSELIIKKGHANSQLEGFFWQRTSGVTWIEIKKLIDQANFSKIHIHTAIDPPGYDLIMPSKEDHLRYEITTSNWFANKDEYLKKVAESQVFFAPRLYEGIGMSFLEAMAIGRCVVAPNNPTMNEYITHGYNGLLYNPKDPQPLDFSNIDELCSNAKKYISEGFARWSKHQQKMIDFIAGPKRRKFFHFQF